MQASSKVQVHVLAVAWDVQGVCSRAKASLGMLEPPSCGPDEARECSSREGHDVRYAVRGTCMGQVHAAAYPSGLPPKHRHPEHKQRPSLAWHVSVRDSVVLGLGRQNARASAQLILQKTARKKAQRTTAPATCIFKL